MKFGIGLPAYADAKSRVSPHRLKQFAKKAEASNFSCAWTGEHVVQPPTYQYIRSEPMTTLSFLAGATADIEYGTGILLLPLRHPVHVAKMAANIQYHADRRFTLGVGMGYVEDDFSAVNVPYEERSTRFTEGLELLYRLLNEDEVTFHGEHYNVDGVTIHPNLDDPPRVLLAGGGVETESGRTVPMAVKKRLLHADGWIASSTSTPEMAVEDWEELAEFLESEGRDPDVFDRLALYRTYLVPNVDADAAKMKQKKRFANVIGADQEIGYAEDRYGLGSIADIRNDIAVYESNGFDQLDIIPSTFNMSELLKQVELLDDYILSNFR